MSVRIRLARLGAKKRPQYLIVAVQKRSSRDGKYLARIGTYHPLEKDPKAKVKIDLEALNAWKAKGAQLSKTVQEVVRQLT